jgi:hypothetical protein
VVRDWYAAMKVTSPEMIRAVRYLSNTDGTRMNRNTVVAIIEASENERTS